MLQYSIAWVQSPPTETIEIPLSLPQFETDALCFCVLLCHTWLKVKQLIDTSILQYMLTYTLLSDCDVSCMQYYPR
jgi:hypothetical protein